MPKLVMDRVRLKHSLATIDIRKNREDQILEPLSTVHIPDVDAPAEAHEDRACDHEAHEKQRDKMRHERATKERAGLH